MRATINAAIIALPRHRILILIVARLSSSLSRYRELPVHPKAVSIIERRMKGVRDEFLFEGLTPGGPDEKRSWYVSKAYGRFRQQIGVVPSSRTSTPCGTRTLR